MNDLLKTELLIEFSQENTNAKIEIAYDKFTKQVRNLNQSDEDYQRVFRTLNFTRIEFVSLQSLSQYEQGGKCA